jgi:hypothetical protein
MQIYASTPNLVIMRRENEKMTSKETYKFLIRPDSHVENHSVMQSVRNL